MAEDDDWDISGIFTVFALAMISFYCLFVLYECRYETIDGWMIFGIVLYLIQMIAFPYFLYNYLYKNIAGPQPESCSPSPGTNDDDDSTTFFADWIDKCSITLGTSSNKKGLRKLFLTIIVLKTLIDVIILGLILPKQRDNTISKYMRVKAKAVGTKAAAGVKSAGREGIAGAKKVIDAVSKKEQRTPLPDQYGETDDSI